MKNINRRLFTAMACYVVLLLAALYFLTPVRTSEERFLLWAVLLIITVLAIKTMAHADDDDNDGEPK